MRRKLGSSSGALRGSVSRSVSYDETISEAVKVVEAVGASIMVFGGAVVFAVYVPRIVADIVRTIVVDQTFESVAVLGVIVIVRILLSFSLEVEMDGMWPWNRWRRADPDEVRRRA